ncbi:MAG: uroporphyrinogen decarboxylase family protein [Anaerofustis sp.]
MVDANKLKQDRINLVKNTITKKEKTNQIFHFGNLFSWKIYDAGYKLSEALNDYAIMEKVIRHTFENYKIDSCYETGWRNPIQVTESLGNDEYVINDVANSINIHDQCFMEAEDYPALIADPKKFLWQTFLPRKYKALKKDTNSPDFRNFLGKYGEFGAFMGRVGEIQNEFGIPDFTDPAAAIDYSGNGYEILFCFLRGIKGLAYDIRRDPEKVLAAMDAIDQTFAIPKLERAKAQQPKGTNPNFCVDTNPVMLGHIILSPKQFEKFYWPHLKRVIELTETQDKLAFVFAEGASDRFYDFFQEFPKDRFVLLAEMNDIFEMRKRLPNVTMMGGMTTDLLGKGTAQECVDYTKHLIDTLGPDGFIFSENKMISFPYDCTHENLKAVSDFVSSYRF